MSKTSIKNMPKPPGAAAALLASPLLASPVMAERPMYYLETFGPKGRETAELIWGLSALSIAVVVITGALILAGIFLRRSRLRVEDAGYKEVSSKGSGHAWIYIGVGVSTLVLIAFVWWTFVVFDIIDQPGQKPEITIEVTAHQWWWEVSYVGGEPNETFVTANEIHIPVGEPVLFKLKSADVIHSFWVPKLAGKTDLIPGRTNETWLQADQPGVYRGQCAEYCGLQHANMGVRIVAQPKREFLAWRDHQLEPADAPESQAVAEGREQFVLRCSVCHTVRGTRATGKVGPDLTHLMSRETLAAGMLENTIGNLSGWITNPQNIKPGSEMPNIIMSGPELNSLRTYLLTLD
jgi:cytochrome c oxidase subunit 2